MFYSANGNLFYRKKIYEFFDPTEEDLELINSYKENITYSSLDVDTQKNLDSLINYIVQEGNNTIRKYSTIEIESERAATKKQIDHDFKVNKDTNNVITTLKRMIQYNGGDEYLDSLYYNQSSLFNNFVKIDNWATSTNSSSTCNSLKDELSTYFEDYNKGKAEKDEADISIINIKKQQISAQQQKNIAIKNINKAANNYNDALVKLHLQNCS